MEEPLYLLCRLALGSPEQISLTKDQYESLSASRDCLSELASLEEKFFALSESYRDVEKVIFDITLNRMLYSGVNAPELYANSASFARQIVSFMSVVRLYLDTIATHAREMTGGKIQKSAVKSVLSARYDRSFYYRSMEAIRNYAQHRAFPVHSSSYGAGWNESRTENTYRVEFLFETKSVRNDSMFKKKVLEEIERVGGKIDLMISVRQYFSDLCGIHCELRTLVSSWKAEAKKDIDYWRNQWTTQSRDPSLVGVGAFKFDGECIDPDGKRAFLDLQIDEYREWLEAKTASVENMAHRRIGLYNQNENKPQ